MDKTVIRRSRKEDTEKILAMLLEMDSSDYLQKIWPVWMQDADNVQLVAMIDGRIAGCIHGRLSAGQDAWAQGLRVRADLRRRSIATYLITALEEELRRKGAHTVFATISKFNNPSLSTVGKLNWKVALTVIRRRLKTDPQRAADPRRPSLNLPEISRPEILRIVRLSGVLASRRAASFFKRIYFSTAEGFLKEAMAAGLVKTNASPAAFAILDPEPAEDKGLWVIALSGPPSGLTPLLINLAEEAARNELDLVVDSPDDPVIQAVLDDLSFAPAGKDGQFVVVKKELL